MKDHHAFVTLLAVFVGLGLATPLVAQAPATVSGSVVDTTKAALPGTTVTLRNIETAKVLTGTTAEDGKFKFPAPPGTYDFEAVLSGFMPFRQRVTVRAGETQTIEAVLRIGGISDEITVTATRREQDVQDVPISIAAYDKAAMADLNLVTSADIPKFTPNLVFATTAGEGQKANVVMRGVGLNSSDELIESNVGLYEDDVYISSTSAFSFDLFDVERVEVLRGPQGTLFGNNATGGLIHHINRSPTDKLEGHIDVRTGSYGQRRLEAAGNVPITSKLKLRLAGVFNQNDGWFKNTYVPTDKAVRVIDNNMTASSAVRGQLLWQPVDKVDVLFRGRWTQNDPPVGATFKPLVAYIPTTGPYAGLGIALPADAPNPYGSCTGCDRAGNPNSIGDGDIRSGSRNQFGDLFLRRSGGGVKLDWHTQRMSLTSISDYDTVKKYYSEDSDGGPKQSVTQFSNTKNEQVQQEVRLAVDTKGVHWSTGIFYLHRNMNNDFAVDYRGSDFAAPPWLQITRYDRQSDHISVFGRAEWAITSRLSVTPGIRWFRESVNNLSWRDRYFTNGTYGQDQNLQGTVVFKDPIWRVDLQYHLSNSAQVYASAGKGERPGFFNTNVSEVAVAPVVQPEKLYAYEAGAKLDVPRAPVRLNVSGYYYDYKDMQTRAFLGFQSYMRNVNSKVYGGEVEVTARPVNTLFLYLTSGFLHGRVLHLQNGTTKEYRDTEQPNAPAFTMSGQARYTWAIKGNNAVFASANVAHRAHAYGEVENNPVQMVPAYTIVGARLGFQSSNGWEVGVQADNLLNEDYFTFIGFVSSINTAQRFPGRPRWVGVYFNYSFGQK